MKPYLVAMLALLSLPANAEQFFEVGDARAHYIVLNTLFLEPEVARQYKIVRGNDRAIVNVSLISAAGSALSANVTGSARNLLGQLQTLEFTEVRENEAVYYIAPITYTNRDTLTFSLQVSAPGLEEGRFQFHKQMFLDSDQ